jgi:hypothetical protein
MQAAAAANKTKRNRKSYHAIKRFVIINTSFLQFIVQFSLGYFYSIKKIVVKKIYYIVNDYFAVSFIFDIT